MASADDLARMVPGFDFMQGLLKNASAGLPNMGQWIAPTLNPEELDKRIQELKTVQFWLDQNAKLLGATIQGLEVQKLTLNTLQSMNFPLAEIGEALKIKLPSAPAASVFAAPEPAPAPAPTPAAAPAVQPEPPAAASADTPAAAPLVDPMQWWGALTQQFTEIAAKAVKDAASGEVALGLPGAMAKAPGTAARKALGSASKAPRAAAKAKPAAARKPAR